MGQKDNPKVIGLRPIEARALHQQDLGLLEHFLDECLIICNGVDVGIQLRKHVKRRTGLEHWNEICRIAICRSLSNRTPPPKFTSGGESPIEMEWKTFAGDISSELSALILLRAYTDGIDIHSKDALAGYFRAHLERGIGTLQNVRSIAEMVNLN